MVYGTQITIVMGVYKPTYNWAAPHHIATGHHQLRSSRLIDVDRIVLKLREAEHFRTGTLELRYVFDQSKEAWLKPLTSKLWPHMAS